MSLLLGISSIEAIAVDIVPPEVPPFKLYAVYDSAMLAKPPVFSFRSCAERNTRMSDGSESNPHDGMMTA